MRVLDRYLVGSVCRSVGLAMAVLVVLLAVFLYINEQGWVGVGRYGNLQALRYVLLHLPAVAVQFLPVAALIGGLLALGALARGSELTVMRAAGVSVGRIAAAVAGAGVLLVPLAAVVGEFLAPPLVQMARVTKALERDAGISVTSRSGLWLRDGALIVHAGQGVDGPITVFELGPGHSLQRIADAAEAVATAPGSWELRDYRASRFADGGVVADSAGRRILPTRANPEFLGVMARDPADLSLRELWRSIDHLEANGQDARRQRFAFWSAVARLAALPLALLLAVPLMFGSLRSAETGTRATLGFVLGLAYFIGQRIVESGTIAFGLDPLLLAWLPTLLLGVAVAVLLYRGTRGAQRAAARRSAPRPA